MTVLTSPLLLMWINTTRCLVSVKDPKLIGVLSPSKYTSRYKRRSNKDNNGLCLLLLYFYSNFAIILMGKRELAALLSLSSWCLLIVVWLFLVVIWVCLQFVVVVFPDHTHLFYNDSTVYTTEYWSKRRPTVKPQCPTTNTPSGPNLLIYR